MESNEVSRRGFLAAGAGSLALSVLDQCCSPAPAAIKTGTHHIPPDKNLHPAWVEHLFAKATSKTYAGDELTCIGMPIGGICAGQLYLRGDGTLAEWGIFNVARFTGFGDTSYRTYTPPSPVQHGFGIAATPKGGETAFRTLDKHSFPEIEFSGEYPVGKVHYRLAKNSWPLDVSRGVQSLYSAQRAGFGHSGNRSALSSDQHGASPGRRVIGQLDSKPGRPAACRALHRRPPKSGRS